MRRIERDEEQAEQEDGGKKRKPFVRLPDLVIVDGGKGQLSMAVKELNRLGLHDLPVIGLAKQREEVFRPGEPEPLLIPHDKGALKLLQRIRDEAHRFANGYHQLLMKRRVEESILDDCPGVSRARKERLLEKFGSLTRLRKATPEQIAKVQGITQNLALEIVHFLKNSLRNPAYSQWARPQDRANVESNLLTLMLFLTRRVALFISAVLMAALMPFFAFAQETAPPLVELEEKDPALAPVLPSASEGVEADASSGEVPDSIAIPEFEEEALAAEPAMAAEVDSSVPGETDAVVEIPMELAPGAEQGGEDSRGNRNGRGRHR